MADVPYLKGGEEATAGRMNTLFMELDRRLAATLSGGKSFLLAQTGQFPANLMGKCFFFFPGGWPINNGQALPVYAQRAAAVGYQGTAGSSVVDPTTGQPIPGTATVPWPYTHSLFTGRVTAQVGSATYDETAKVCQLPAAAEGDYDTVINDGTTTDTYAVTLPHEPYLGSLTYGFGFFENSLAVHYVLHQGASDAAPVPYLVKDGPYAVPERPLDWAVAEVVCEGLTALVWDAAWDKYCFFRIHNLHLQALTVTFPGGFAVTVPPYGCQTVRRDRVAGGPPYTFKNYRTGGNYFWRFEGGDPRSYWFIPRQVTWDGTNMHLLLGAMGPRAVNGTVANNLWNPSVLFDWVNALSMEDDKLASAQAVFGYSSWGEIPQATTGGTYDTTKKVYARMVRDRTVLWDAGALHRQLYGDPGNPATLVGDLLHHKGQFIIVRRSKTDKLADGVTPVTVWEWADFNGYATIVADLAAHQLTVAEDGNGDLTITNADTANDVILIPVTTNFLKRSADFSAIEWDGMQDAKDGIPGHRVVQVMLNDSLHRSTPFTIESAVLEVPHTGADFALGNAGPQLVFARTLSVTANTKDWYAARYGPVYNSAAGVYIDPTTVTGDPAYTLVNVGPYPGQFIPYPVSTTETINSLHGIHRVTVGDVLGLKYWRPAHLAANNAVDGGTGITLSSYENARCRLTNEGLVLTFDEVVANIQPDVTSASVNNDWWQWAVGQLRRTRVVKFRGHGWGYNSPSVGARTTLFFTPNNPFWSTTFTYKDEVAAGKDLSGWATDVPRTTLPGKLMFRVQVPPNLDQAPTATWKSRIWSSGVPAINQAAGYFGDTGAQYGTYTGVQANTYGTAAPPLLAEHYNAMARQVNACSKGFGLTAAALYFRLGDGTVTSFVPGYYDSEGVYYRQETFPVPVQAFATFASGSSMAQLCSEKGIATFNFRSGAYDLSQYADARSYAPAVGMRTVLGGSAYGRQDPAPPPAGQSGPNLEDVTYDINVAVTGPVQINHGTPKAPASYNPPPPIPGFTGDWPGPLGAYEFNADGICLNTGQIYLKGDLIIGTDNGRLDRNGNPITDGYGGCGVDAVWHRRNLWPPGGVWCNSLPTGAGVVQLFPTGAGGVFGYDRSHPNVYPPDNYTWMPCLGSLGTWGSNNSLPPNQAGGNLGHYYETSTGGSASGLTWRKGNRLVWMGSGSGQGWWLAASPYDDLQWCTVDAVRIYLESLGFDFMFNEGFVPLELKQINGFNAVPLPGGAAACSGSIVLDASTRGIVGSTGTFGNASYTDDYSKSYGSEVLTPGDLPEQQWRFSPFTNNPTWKLRTSLGAVASAGFTPTLVDVKGYTPGLEPVLMSRLYQVTVNLASGAVVRPDGGTISYIRLDVAGNLGGVYYPTYRFKETTPGSGTYVADEPDVNTLCYGALRWTAADPRMMEEWLNNGFNPNAVRQYCQLAFLQNNSNGIVGQTTITLTPAGTWGKDGTYWPGNLAWVLTGLPVLGTCNDRMPAVWYPPIGGAVTVQPGDGITFLRAPTGCAAYVQCSSLTNLIDLSGLPAATAGTGTGSAGAGGAAATAAEGGTGGTGEDEPMTGE